VKTSTKRCFRRGWLVPLLAFYCALVTQLSGQTFTTLHSFTEGDDGGFLSAGLITNSSGNSLYGTAANGGKFYGGTVFKLSPDGTGFSTVHAFNITNSYGSGPRAGLILSGNTFYGTTIGYGRSGSGTVFKLQTDGTGFTTLYNFAPSPLFTNSDGRAPYAELVLSGNTLYGTTVYGSSSGNGTVFAINADGTAFTNLHSFSAGSRNSSDFWAFYTNSDGAYSDGAYPSGLTLSGDALYGATGNGGSNGSGTVFAINTDGTGFTTLYNFTARSGYLFNINSDGANPSGRLVLSGNTLYGTAAQGGSFGNGTVFKVQTDGTGFTTLYNFHDGTSANGLMLAGKTLYGTTRWGGSSGNGTVFAINTDGTGFTNLYNFTPTSANSWFPTNSDGANPQAGLILLGNTLYGTTWTGGTWGYGTVFSLSFPPQLSSGRFGPNVVLSWPTNYVGFGYSGYTLQSATDLTSGNWTNLPAPIVVNGQNTVTNPVSGTQRFFRLSQ